MTERFRDSAPSLNDVWERLLVDGYTLVVDDDPQFGFDPSFRQHLLDNYFNSGRLEPERYDVFPPDRERSRDVVLCIRSPEDSVRLSEYPTVTISDRSYFGGEREYARTYVMQDPHFVHWIERGLALIPPTSEYAESTFGINLFRTHSSVVSGPHQDGEQLVMVYVIDKRGGGGVSQLHAFNSDKSVFSVALRPGQFLLFDDTRFRHSVTPLEPAADGVARRDALVCTFNWPNTYPFRSTGRDLKWPLDGHSMLGI